MCNDGDTICLNVDNLISHDGRGVRTDLPRYIRTALFIMLYIVSKYFALHIFDLSQSILILNAILKRERKSASSPHQVPAHLRRTNES